MGNVVIKIKQSNENSSVTATQNYNIGIESLGQNNNTKQAYNTAIKCFNKYALRTICVFSFAQITNEIIEKNNNLRVLQLNFAV